MFLPTVSFLRGNTRVKAQLGEEGYFGDTEKSDTESEDSYRMDNNENEIEEGKFLHICMLVL